MVLYCCPRRDNRQKSWDMARQEQVLVLEPQQELKFRGNAKAEGRAEVRQLALDVSHYLCQLLLFCFLIVSSQDG